MQKGRYYFTKIKDNKAPRYDFSRTQPHWQHSSNSSSKLLFKCYSFLDLGLFNMKNFANMFAASARMRYINSKFMLYVFFTFYLGLDSAFGTTSSGISPPFTAFSNESVFDFPKN